VRLSSGCDRKSGFVVVCITHCRSKFYLSIAAGGVVRWRLAICVCAVVDSLKHDVLWRANSTLWWSVLCRGVTAGCGRQPKGEHAHLCLIHSAAGKQADGVILGQLCPFCRWD